MPTVCAEHTPAAYITGIGNQRKPSASIYLPGSVSSCILALLIQAGPTVAFKYANHTPNSVLFGKCSVRLALSGQFSASENERRPKKCRAVATPIQRRFGTRRCFGRLAKLLLPFCRMPSRTQTRAVYHRAAPFRFGNRGRTVSFPVCSRKGPRYG